MNYATWVATLSNLTVIDSNDVNFQQILPECEEYASNRLYRELDLLNTVTRQTGLLTANNRNFTLPSSGGRFVVTNGINIITPSSATDPDSGALNQCTPVSRDYLDMAWPSVTGAGLPEEYAMITDQTVVFGPWPDAAYTAQVIGTYRPAALSVSNTTTPLTLYWPDLYVAASMVFMSGYQKNWGAQSDDPKMSASWETQYQTLFASANTETNRSKYASGAWGSLQPTTIATPSR
jgi:hypothetical protein